VLRALAERFNDNNYCANLRNCTTNAELYSAATAPIAAGDGN